MDFYIGCHKYDVNLNCGKRYIDMIPKMPLLEKTKRPNRWKLKFVQMKIAVGYSRFHQNVLAKRK